VQFYFDGQAVGAPQTLTGFAQIPAQTRNWHLLEDSAGGDEVFLGGDFDEAALWLRALSAEEMAALFSQSLALAPVPEPASGWLLTFGVVCVIRSRKARSAGARTA